MLHERARTSSPALTLAPQTLEDRDRTNSSGTSGRGSKEAPRSDDPRLSSILHTISKYVPVLEDAIKTGITIVSKDDNDGSPEGGDPSVLREP
jgi:hypothetical protein